MNKNPLISIVLPVFNCEAYLSDAIQSILIQSFSDFELIVINDASTDSSQSIIQSFNDKRIREIVNKQNLGLAKSLNIGFKLAKGQYIARMDADDISMPSRLEKQFLFMEENPDIDISGADYELFGEKTRIVKLPYEDREIKDTLFFNSCIAHPTVIFRHESIKKYMIKYNEKFLYSQDYELWCRLIDKLSFANIPDVLLKYRVHKKQSNQRKVDEQSNNANLIRKMNLEKIGVDFHEKLFKDYLSIINYDFKVSSKIEVLRAAEILMQIFEKGKIFGYSDSFFKKLGEYWWSIIRQSVGFGFSIRSFYLTISLIGYLPLTKYEKIRFFLRCIKHGIL